MARNVATDLRRMFPYLNRKILIPIASSIHRKLLTCYMKVISTIKANIPWPVKVSIPADAWTFPNKLWFLAVLVYYITDKYELKRVLIGFEQIKEAHAGKNLAHWQIIEADTKRYDFTEQLLGFTSHNGNNNTTLSNTLISALRFLSIEWNCESNHIPCIAHISQLILGAFMKELEIMINGEKMPSCVKDTSIDKVKAQEEGFYKTVEKVRVSFLRCGPSTLCHWI
jgi:hypothetical protein